MPTTSMSWIGFLVNAIAVLCPLAMAILSQRCGTRYWRIRVYPLGVVSSVLAVLMLKEQTRRTYSAGDTPNPLNGIYANTLLVHNISLIGLYAFSNDIYQPHPIPSSVKWRAIRSSRVFRVLDIYLSSDRQLNYSPNPTPSPKKSALIQTFKSACIHSLLIDFFTLPTGYLRDYNLYNPDGTRDYKRWCATLSAEFGAPVIFIKMGLVGCYAGTIFSGLQGGWAIAKVIGVGSGLWAEEEWVDVMDSPHRSTSMIDLWGKRYHQTQFNTILSPFQLPKPAFLFASFLISGLHHLLILCATRGSFPWHYLQFFMGCGCICLIEYSIYKTTGRRVEGLTGWVWTISWMFLLGSRPLEKEVECGGFEGFRMPIEIFGYSAYALDHVVNLIKWSKRTV